MNIDDQVKFINEKMGSFHLSYYKEDYMGGYSLSNRTDEGLGTGKEYRFSDKYSIENLITKAYNFFACGQTDAKIIKIISDLKTGIEKLKFKSIKVTGIEDAGGQVKINYGETGLSDVNYDKMTALEEIEYQDKKMDDSADDIELLHKLIDSVTDDRRNVDLEWCGFIQDKE